MHAHAHRHTHTHMHVHTYMYTHTRTYTNTHVHTHTHTDQCVKPSASLPYCILLPMKYYCSICISITHFVPYADFFSETFSCFASAPRPLLVSTFSLSFSATCQSAEQRSLSAVLAKTKTSFCLHTDRQHLSTTNRPCCA